jgi:hypothetical protein
MQVMQRSLCGDNVVPRPGAQVPGKEKFEVDHSSGELRADR